jgi:hypothetical protein
VDSSATKEAVVLSVHLIPGLSNIFFSSEQVTSVLQGKVDDGAAILLVVFIILFLVASVTAAFVILFAEIRLISLRMPPRTQRSTVERRFFELPNNRITATNECLCKTKFIVGLFQM